jgi:hypothetical protein
MTGMFHLSDADRLALVRVAEVMRAKKAKRKARKPRGKARMRSTAGEGEFPGVDIDAVHYKRAALA